MRALQGAVLLAGLVPVSAGLAGALLGQGMMGIPLSPGDAALDSHIRYLSGLLLGIGLVFWWMVPDISRHRARFRLLTAIVMLGGLARLAGLAIHGTPPASMLAALVMELLVTPALCLWQGRVACRMQAG